MLGEGEIILDIAQKIRQMNEYCEDTQQIADTLGMSKEVIDKFLDGIVPADALESYDLSKPPDIRVVKDDNIKTVEEKLSKIEDKIKPSFFFTAWEWFKNIVWLSAIALSASVTIYLVYLAGLEKGFEYELLTRFALGIESVFKAVFS